MVERKYKMLRDKNNEASRRSRLNRTQKALVADVQVKRLEKKQGSLNRKLDRLNACHAKLMGVLQVMLSS